MNGWEITSAIGLRYLAHNFGQIVNGLDIIAQNVRTHEKKITSTAEQLRGIAGLLKKLAKHLADDENKSKASKIDHDLPLFVHILRSLVDETFNSFSLSPELGIDDLCEKLVHNAADRAGIGLFEHVSLLHAFAGCFVATLTEAPMNHRFVRLQNNIWAFTCNYSAARSRKSLAAFDARLMQRHGDEPFVTAGAERPTPGSDRNTNTTPRRSRRSDIGVASTPSSIVILPEALPPPERQVDRSGEVDMSRELSLSRLATPAEPRNRTSHSAYFPKADFSRPFECDPREGLQARAEDTVRDLVLDNIGARVVKSTVQDHGSSALAYAAGLKGFSGSNVRLGAVSKEDFCAAGWSEENCDNTVSLHRVPTPKPLPPGECYRPGERYRPEPHIRTRWWHLHRRSMSFAEFHAVALNATCLRDGEREEVSKVLGEVHRRATDSGGSDSYLPADVISEICIMLEPPPPTLFCCFATLPSHDLEHINNSYWHTYPTRHGPLALRQTASRAS